MADLIGAERRDADDRRRRTTKPWDAFRTPARRESNRRTRDATRHLVVDRHGAALFGMVVALLLLTILDGVLTLMVVESHKEELNPLMARLMERGVLWFILGKYVITASCLPWLLIWKNHGLFRTRFRVKYLIPVFVVLYLALTATQVWAVNDPRGLARTLHLTSSTVRGLTLEPMPWPRP